MTDPDPDPRFAPPGHPSLRPVKAPLAASLLLVVVIYCGSMAVPLILGGSMMNEMMFIAGLVHLGLAGAFFVAWKGLMNRQRWGKTLGMVLTALGVIAPAIAIIASLVDGSFEPGLLIFPGLLSLYFAVLLWVLSRTSIDDELAGKSALVK
jgi:hypothetical protein